MEKGREGEGRRPVGGLAGTRLEARERRHRPTGAAIPLCAARCRSPTGERCGGGGGGEGEEGCELSATCRDFASFCDLGLFPLPALFPQRDENHGDYQHNTSKEGEGRGGRERLRQACAAPHAATAGRASAPWLFEGAADAVPAA